MFLNRFKLNWKYALGEVFLIAVGVLIALAVDGWREYQAERTLESEYLIRIENDLHSSLESWNNQTAWRESAIELLGQMRDGKVDLVTSGNAEVVWDAFMISNWSAVLGIRSSAFDELVSTGQLSIIENAALRDSISNFYTEYSSVVEISRQAANFDFQHFTNSVVPHDLFNAAQVLHEFDGSRINEAFEDLRSRPEFDELSNAQLIRLSGDIVLMRMYRAWAVELLDEIAAHENR